MLEAGKRGTGTLPHDLHKLPKPPPLSILPATCRNSVARQRSCINIRAVQDTTRTSTSVREAFTEWMPMHMSGSCASSSICVGLEGRRPRSKPRMPRIERALAWIISVESSAPRPERRILGNEFLRSLRHVDFVIDVASDAASPPTIPRLLNPMTIFILPDWRQNHCPMT